MSFDKISRLLAIVLGSIGLVFTLLIFFGGESSLETNVSISIWISIAMFFIAIGLAIFSAVRGMIINPASLRGSAIGFGALAAILAISYMISSGADHESYKNMSESGSRWVSTGLNATYIMTLLSVGAIVFSSLNRLRK
ncbi:MAG: hypothetical protein EXR22_06945 [Flavobacteriaceae bacterium]|nr:hypothetical protein [Flavobacteriaceae bacterium]